MSYLSQVSNSEQSHCFIPLSLFYFTFVIYFLKLCLFETECPVAKSSLEFSSLDLTAPTS